MRREKGQRADRKSIKCQEGSKVDQTAAEPGILEHAESAELQPSARMFDRRR